MKNNNFEVPDINCFEGHRISNNWKIASKGENTIADAMLTAQPTYWQVKDIDSIL